jgi:hypothetical protein
MYNDSISPELKEYLKKKAEQEANSRNYVNAYIQQQTANSIRRGDKNFQNYPTDNTTLYIMGGILLVTLLFTILKQTKN